MPAITPGTVGKSERLKEIELEITEIERKLADTKKKANELTKELREARYRLIVCRGMLPEFFLFRE